MRETVLIIWTLLLPVLGFILMFVLKRQKRKLGKYVMIYNLVLLLLAIGLSFLVYKLLGDSIHIIWASRLLVFLMGGFFTWFVFTRKWVLRSKYEFSEDAFAIEFLFLMISGILCSAALVTAPQLFEIIPYRIDVSRSLWEAPIYFLLPFLMLKLTDLAGQVPFRTVENPWPYPLEAVNPEDWPWRNLMQINFQVKRSLLDEYNLFTWPAKPWIEGPKEVSLGGIFRLVTQERRQRSELSSIQDLGDEYDGAPQFCWLFSIKVIWYNPGTWFRKPRYLNPDFTITKNRIQKGDVIIAKRVPGDGSKPAGLSYDDMQYEDTEKTVIIRK